MRPAQLESMTTISTQKIIWHTVVTLKISTNKRKYPFRATNPVDFQKSPSSDFIWCGTILGIRISYGARGGTSRGRPLRSQKMLAPLAKRSTCIKYTNPVVVNYMEKKLDITKSRYSEQMFLPVLCKAFVLLKFHCLSKRCCWDLWICTNFNFLFSNMLQIRKNWGVNLVQRR